MTEEQIHSLHFYQKSRVYDEKDKATIHYADLVTRGASAVTAQTLENLRKYYTEDEIVELTLVICMANLTNRFNDALLVDSDLG